MSSTTTDIALTAFAIKALRTADDVYAHLHNGEHYLSAVKRVTSDERARVPFIDDKKVDVPCEGIVRRYDGEYTSEPGVVACFANVWHSSGIWQIVKPGDRLRLVWSRGGHTSDNLRNASFVGDSLTIEVLRKNDTNGQKPLAFLADTYAGPDNSARLCRTHA